MNKDSGRSGADAPSGHEASPSAAEEASSQSRVPNALTDEEAAQWERDCETLAEIVDRLQTAPAAAIYANEDSWWGAYEGLGHIYNDWLMDRLEDDEDRDAR